tara:strand:+ start:419 stop:691 length:273 start_codon:yes stop_codon:yes gene_type:complete
MSKKQNCEITIYKVDWVRVLEMGMDKPAPVRSSYNYRELMSINGVCFEDGETDTLLLTRNEYLLLLFLQTDGIRETGKGKWARAIKTRTS